MSGIALDDRSFERMRRAVRWVEDQAGETAPPANQGGGGGAGRWFRTNATEPASYDGSMGFPGHLVEMDSEGTEFRLTPGKVYDPNESRLAPDTLYRVVYRGSENNEPSFWSTSGAAASQAEGVKFARVVPWRYMKVYNDYDQWALTALICVNSYRYFWTAKTTDPTTFQDAPDLTKIPLPGDPRLSDSNYFGDSDGTDFSLYMHFPGYEVGAWYPFPGIPPYSFDFKPGQYTYQDEAFPVYWYNALVAKTGFPGGVCISGHFAKSKWYVRGYGNEKHYLYTDFWAGDPSRGTLDMRLITKAESHPVVTKVRYSVYPGDATRAYGDTVKTFRYYSGFSGWTGFKLRYLDQFGLLLRDSTVDQLILAQIVENSNPLGSYWQITQVYHPKPPGELALTPVDPPGWQMPVDNYYGSLGSAGLAQSTTSQDSFLISSAPADSLFELTRNPGRIPGGNVPGGGGGFSAGTGGEE